MRFIEMLKIKLIHHWIIVQIADDHVDTLIVNTAIINVWSYLPKIIVIGENIDKLVIFI